MMASRQYASNQFGMSNGDPKPKRGKGNKDKGDAVQVCSKDNPGGCGWASDSGSPSNAQNTGGAPGLSMKPRYKKQVLNKRQAKRWAKKMEKIRANAPAMNTQPKKQREAVAGPPAPKTTTNQTPVQAPKKTLGQRIKAAFTGPRKVKKMKV